MGQITYLLVPIVKLKNNIMKFKILLVILIGTLISCQNIQTENKKYEAKWSSLSKHNESPQWFKDSKFGIYFHWGVYSVPEFNSEWYPRNMHLKDHKVYKYHLENYGHPSEFGYHDFVPMFKAEKFNSSEWARLFKDAGAKFAGPVAEHHDGFSMWASKVSPWNVYDKGPKKDIMMELKNSIEENDMKFIATFHHAKHLQRSKTINQENPLSHYPFLDDMPTSSNDPELSLLYGNMDENKWYENIWFGKLKEVIDNYSPDIIWFDYVLDEIPEKFRKKFAAYYLNNSNDKEVVIVRKQHDLPQSLSIEDLEQSRKNEIGNKTWMTDATVSDGSWSYTKNLKVKSASKVLHMLIDIVSKNGVLLLNVSPKANGEIPKNQIEVLESMGRWLKKNGESIYGTEAWYRFGEGPTVQPEGHFKNRDIFHKLEYSSKDIRYTVKNYDIYAIFLGEIKGNQKVILKSFSKEAITDLVRVKDVELLETRNKLNWNLDSDGLHIEIPEGKYDELASVIKITTDG